MTTHMRVSDAEGGVADPRKPATETVIDFPKWQNQNNGRETKKLKEKKKHVKVYKCDNWMGIWGREYHPVALSPRTRGVKWWWWWTSSEEPLEFFSKKAWKARDKARPIWLVLNVNTAASNLYCAARRVECKATHSKVTCVTNISECLAIFFFFFFFCCLFAHPPNTREE